MGELKLNIAVGNEVRPATSDNELPRYLWATFREIRKERDDFRAELVASEKENKELRKQLRELTRQEPGK